MSTENNTKPVHTFRAESIKASIWRNFGEKGTFYSVRITRTWKDKDGNYHDSYDFAGVELVVVSQLAARAYEKICELHQADRDQRAGAS